jgi:hypothetical protein
MQKGPFMRFARAAFLSAAFLISAAFVIFGNSGTIHLVQKGTHWNRGTAASESGDTAKEWRRVAAQSPLHQICSRVDCDRPAIVELSYEGGSVLYFCDQHRPPNRLIASSGSFPGFYNDEDGNSYNTLKRPPGGPGAAAPLPRAAGLLRALSWAASLAGFGFCVLAVIVFLRLEKPKTALTWAGATLAIAVVIWLLAYGYASRPDVS